MLSFTGGDDRLDDEYVPLADVLADLDEDVLVAELVDLDAARRDIDVGTDRARQLRVGVPAEDGELIIEPHDLDRPPPRSTAR
jgi:hypothetical protein